MAQICRRTHTPPPLPCCPLFSLKRISGFFQPSGRLSVWATARIRQRRASQTHAPSLPPATRLCALCLYTPPAGVSSCPHVRPVAHSSQSIAFLGVLPSLQSLHQACRRSLVCMEPPFILLCALDRHPCPMLSLAYSPQPAIPDNFLLSDFDSMKMIFLHQHSYLRITPSRLGIGVSFCDEREHERLKGRPLLCRSEPWLFNRAARKH